MMHIDWKNELETCISKIHRLVLSKDIYIFPPNSLICVVTTASPIQTSAKTPEKTAVFCELDAVIESSKLRSRQNINGPLYARLKGLPNRLLDVSAYRVSPKIPVPQAFRHATLKYYIGIWPSSSNTSKTSCKAVSLAPFCASDASTSL